MNDYISLVLEFMGQIVEKYGAWGLAMAMFAESAGVPFASSVVFLSAGSLIYSGKISFLVVFISSTAGITLGSIAGYILGYISRVMGRALKLTVQIFRPKRRPSRENGKSKIWQFMETYGSFSIFMAQFFGLTRTFISFPAGIMKLNLPLFILYTALGGALFSLASISLSMLLTSILRVFYRYLRLFLIQPFWVWLLAAALVLLLVWIYRRLGWKFPLNKLLAQGKSWLERKT